MKIRDFTTSAVGAGPMRCNRWPAPGCPESDGAPLAVWLRRQGGIDVVGNGVSEFLQRTAPSVVHCRRFARRSGSRRQQKEVSTTDSQRFEERDCRVGSSHGHGRRCIGANQASQRGCQKNSAELSNTYRMALRAAARGSRRAARRHRRSSALSAMTHTCAVRLPTAHPKFID